MHKNSKNTINQDMETKSIFMALQLLNPQQLLSFKELALTESAKISDEQFLRYIKERFVTTSSGCPHCSSKNFIRFGKSKLQRQCFKCKDCGRIFSDSTDSPLCYTKKPVYKWFQYLQCMCKNLSIRESSAEVGIHRNTAFYCRHKILNAIKSRMGDDLTGVIEMNEISICDNFKGNHSKNPFFSMGRPPRRSGRRPQEKIFEDKICILCCKDRLENILSQVTGRGRSKCPFLISLLKDRLSKDSILCTNNNAAYIGLAKSLNLKLYKLTHNNEIQDKIYHIKNATAFGREFLEFLTNFKGVATKYLNFYITWFKWKDTAKKYNYSYKALDLFFLLTSSSNKLRIKDFKFVQSLPH